MPENRVDRELGRRLEAWAEAGKAELGAEVQQELGRKLKASLNPVKPLPSNGALVAQFLVVFAATAAGLMAVVDKAGLHMMTAAQMGAMAALLASGSVYLAIQLVRRRQPYSCAVWVRADLERVKRSHGNGAAVPVANAAGIPS